MMTLLKVVRVQAAVDNLKEPEDLPLAPWY